VATLRLAPGDQAEHLRYAAQTLLDSAGLDLTLAHAQTGDGGHSGLELTADVFVSADLLRNVFAWLTLARELATGRRDRLGRFDETALTWGVSKPWVDRLARALAEKVPDQWQLSADAQESFSVHITHDVDRTTFLEPYCLLGSALAGLGLRRAGRVPLRTTLAPRALLRGLERLLAYEREQGIGARFFMMSGPYGTGRHGTRTNSSWSSWQETANLIQDAGMAIGLHGSYAARDRDSYSEERERLEQALGCAVTTHRNHYLRFDTERIAGQLEAAGISHDFSVGYTSRVGFRSASARIHRAFDPVNKRETGLLLVPLLFMDTFQLARAPEVVFGELQSTLEETMRARGTVSLLFHPEIFHAIPHAWPLFERVISLCHDMGADLSGELA